MGRASWWKKQHEQRPLERVELDTFADPKGGKCGRSGEELRVGQAGGENSGVRFQTGGEAGSRPHRDF